MGSAGTSVLGSAQPAGLRGEIPVWGFWGVSILPVLIPQALQS